MDYRERVSHARSVYPIQGISRMRTSIVNEKEETDTRIIRVVRNLEEINVGTERKSPKQGISNVKNLNSMLTEGHDFPYHESD